MRRKTLSENVEDRSKADTVRAEIFLSTTDNAGNKILQSAGMPKVMLVRVANSRHFAHFDQPDTFNRLL